MDRDIRRRLDVLIWLCSALLGVALTYLVLSSGLMLLVFVLFITGLVAAPAFWYVSRAVPTETREQTNH
ncbi:hypothetical protein AUR64_14805 [Haloprofundus marisrubri]|uniref:Uncharacterized protein n=1 Tax=Haloprofundus marisrubri TaxID=1514971 RepID=A0A0W1R780_9EURY|nr:hypothetical protein [Haloprofundus marisrubri]KTG09068.1 hypothetical protein AUR64_14805 [Haloprofundus marisrubri]